jgi:hypothetical protein
MPQVQARRQPVQYPGMIDLSRDVAGAPAVGHDVPLCQWAFEIPDIEMYAIRES